LNRLFVLRLDRQRYALRLRDVERVLRMVEITALPEAHPSVLGVINVQGSVITVFDLRRCLQLPTREVDSDDVLVLTRTGGAMVALAADGVDGVANWTDHGFVRGEEIRSTPPYLDGVAKLPDGLVLIFDLERLLQMGSSNSASPPP